MKNGSIGFSVLKKKKIVVAKKKRGFALFFTLAFVQRFVGDYFPRVLVLVVFELFLRDDHSGR